MSYRRFVSWWYALGDTLHDAWLAEDKLDHATYAYALFLTVVALGASLRGAWAVVMAAGLAVELVEAWRWWRWRRRGFTQPWPWLCDRASLKDLLADAVGAAAAHALVAWTFA